MGKINGFLIVSLADLILDTETCYFDKSDGRVRDVDIKDHSDIMVGDKDSISFAVYNINKVCKEYGYKVLLLVEKDSGFVVKGKTFSHVNGEDPEYVDILGSTKRLVDGLEHNIDTIHVNSTYLDVARFHKEHSFYKVALVKSKTEEIFPMEDKLSYTLGLFTSFYGEISLARTLEGRIDEIKSKQLT